MKQNRLLRLFMTNTFFISFFNINFTNLNNGVLIEIIFCRYGNEVNEYKEKNSMGVLYEWPPEMEVLEKRKVIQFLYEISIWNLAFNIIFFFSCFLRSI